MNNSMRLIKILPVLLLLTAASAADALKQLPGLEYETMAPPSQRKVIVMAMSVSRTVEFSGKWRTWQNNRHQPDVRTPDGRRDISSIYYPSIGLYDASDPDYIECACQLMHLAGIDAISFFTPDAADSWQLPALTHWVEVMKRYGLTGMPRPQPKSSVQDLDALLNVFQSVTFRHCGRPLLPIFNIDPDRIDALSKWKAAFPPENRPYLVKWLQQTCKPPFDGGFDWCGDATHPLRESATRSGWKRYFDARLAREGYDSDVARARRLIGQGAMKVYIEGLNPGFDDSEVNGWGRGNHYVERAGGESYRYRWAKAVEHGFALACIPTWDDWGEGSMIEPTVEFGNLYLEITREYAARFKGTKPLSGNFDLPQWIYLIRKKTTDQMVLDDLKKAVSSIEKDEWTAAEKQVLPLAQKFGVLNHIYR